MYHKTRYDERRGRRVAGIAEYRHDVSTHRAWPTIIRRPAIGAPPSTNGSSYPMTPICPGSPEPGPRLYGYNKLWSRTERTGTAMNLHPGDMDVRMELPMHIVAAAIPVRRRQPNSPYPGRPGFETAAQANGNQPDPNRPNQSGPARAAARAPKPKNDTAKISPHCIRRNNILLCINIVAEGACNAEGEERGECSMNHE